MSGQDSKFDIKGQSMNLQRVLELVLKAEQVNSVLRSHLLIEIGRICQHSVELHPIDLGMFVAQNLDDDAQMLNIAGFNFGDPDSWSKYMNIQVKAKSTTSNDFYNVWVLTQFNTKLNWQLCASNYSFQDAHKIADYLQSFVNDASSVLATVVLPNSLSLPDPNVKTTR